MTLLWFLFTTYQMIADKEPVGDEAIGQIILIIPCLIIDCVIIFILHLIFPTLFI